MTSINAMRFNEKAGLLICDEQRAWNDEWLKMNSCDKIRPLVSEEISRETGLIVCYGHTGSTSIGDEIAETIRQRVEAKYDETIRHAAKAGKRFMNVEEVAALGYQVMIDVKTKCIDEELLGRYNFTAKDYIKGTYKRNGKDYEIKDKEVIDVVNKKMTWAGRGEDVSGVFLNSAVIAGYHPDGGFRIFWLNMIDPIMEPVQECFLAEGSGLDVTDLMWTQFANRRTIPERRGAVDKIEGTLALIEAMNSACELSAGVGGYLKFVIIDASQSDVDRRLKMFSDRRSRLASEIVRAYTHRLLDEPVTLDLLNALIFEDQPFATVHHRFFDAAPDPVKLDRFLRGYTEARG